MAESVKQSRLAPKLVDSLYIEAMLLADETRGYFDGEGHGDRDALSPLDRVTFSCESLKITTRLMHVVAWLLTRRAIEAGEISPALEEQARRLGHAADSDGAVIAALPDAARGLIEASRDLYARVRRLDLDLDQSPVRASPARGLLSRLEQAF